MARLIDLVKKIENSGRPFVDINNDLGYFVEDYYSKGKTYDDIEPTIYMAYAYARRAAAAGMLLQGIVKQKDYDRVFMIFQEIQNKVDKSTTREGTFKFQTKASDQGLELINSYTNLFNKNTISIIVNVAQRGNEDSYFNNLAEGETLSISNLAQMMQNSLKKMPKDMA